MIQLFSRSQCAGCPQHQQAPLVSLDPPADADYVIALAGNPNVGKSTVFNAITGLRQHTGNWPGKTVARAEGSFRYEDRRYRLIDLPGTYSLLATSLDEEIARDFILFGKPDVTVIVIDATRLERNLNLALQVLEITDRVVVCLNLMDEAARHGLSIDAEHLSREMGVPVVPTSARFAQGVDQLLQVVHEVATGQRPCHPRRFELKPPALEEAVNRLEAEMEKVFPEIPNARWVALRLLDGDEHMARAVHHGKFEGTPALETLSNLPGSSSDGGLDARKADASHNDLLSIVSQLRWQVGPDFHQSLVEAIYASAAQTADRVVTRDARRSKLDLDRALDRLLTSRWFGYPLMILMLTFVLWVTIAGANAPSAMLAWLLLDGLHPILKSGAAAMAMPWWLDGLLIDGMYLATAWVVAVMLPPMAIFFPLFTLLEDFGYLPRVALNLDGLFKRVGAHGKQALTMCMGLGCNAAGVIATRVIDSPRERLLAIITNNFSLCNGRWPTQILLATIFLGALVPSYLAGFVSALAVVCVALLGFGVTLVCSWGLSQTVLRGEVSTFQLELPPYRPPRLLQTLYTSLIDRTIFVLWRAILFALPAGAVIWLIANVPWGNASVAEQLIGWLDPVGLVFGLNGVILLAYLVAIPANEIVIPTILMLTVLTARLSGVGEGQGVMFELDMHTETAHVLRVGGWTVLTAVNVMLFSLLHNPCSTTIYTIWKETGSWKWAVVSTLLPLALGFSVCYLVTQTWLLIAGP
ncbi:MAG: ferrous iron transport protein B [Pirellulaceae bacterium]